jgi:hypothetical protein
MPRIPDNFGQFPRSPALGPELPKPVLPKAPTVPKAHSIPDSAKSPFLSTISIKKFSVDPASVFRQMFGATPK